MRDGACSAPGRERGSLPRGRPGNTVLHLKQTPQLFGDFAHNLNAVEGDESRQAWVEDMDTDKPDPRVRQGRMGQGAGMASMGAGAEQRALPLSCPPTHLCALAQELRTPTKDRAVCEKRSPIHGVVLGATERSYLMRDSQIDVMRNVVGGVEDTGLSFKLTPPPGAAGLGGMGGGGATPTLTPPKALLMNQVRCRGGRRWEAHHVAVLLRGGCSGASGSSGPRLAPHTPAPPSNHPQQERKMNMISPLSGASLWHADIETGKVVSEWKFQKDGVDVAMKDITTENKGAQVRPGGGAAAGNGWRPPAVRVSRQTPDRSASSHTPTPTLLPAPHCRSTTALCSWGWTPTGWHGGTCATRTASCPRPPPPWWRTQAARTTRAAPSSGARAGGYGRLRCRAVRTLGLAEGGARHGCHAFPTTTRHPPPPRPAAAWPPAATGTWWWAPTTARCGCTARRRSRRPRPPSPAWACPSPRSTSRTTVGGHGDGAALAALARPHSAAALRVAHVGWPVRSPQLTLTLNPAGKWVLATTRNYLMVIKTSYKDPKSGKELCGFTNRMGTAAPAPRLLRLKTGAPRGGGVALHSLCVPACLPLATAQPQLPKHTSTQLPSLSLCPTPRPCTRGPEADQERCAGEGALHLDHGARSPGALGRRLVRQLHRALELQVRSQPAAAGCVRLGGGAGVGVPTPPLACSLCLAPPGPCPSAPRPLPGLSRLQSPRW